MRQHSITAYAPVIRQSADSYHELLSTQRERFVISATWGFDTARFQMLGAQEYLRGWLEHGLVRDVEWVGPSGETLWNGYVDTLRLTLDGIAQVRSIRTMFNRIYYVYASLDTTSNPPKTGEQKTTTVNDTDSQDAYGIKTFTHSAGEIDQTAAGLEANRLLTEKVEVIEDETVGFGGAGAAPVLDVMLKGYGHMANWANYSQTVSSGEVDADALISAIVAADPNGIVSTDDTNIDSNTLQVEQYQKGDTPGWTLAQRIADRGDGSGNRWVAGIYEERKVFYKAAEAIDSSNNPLASNVHPALQKHPHDPSGRVWTVDGRQLEPWEVRPDRLVYIVGGGIAPRYAEQVVFTAPASLQIRQTPLNPMRSVVSI